LDKETDSDWVIHVTGVVTRTMGNAKKLRPGRLKERWLER